MTAPDLAALSEAATCPWKIGDKVQRKPGSSYAFPGVVIGVNLKLDGTTWHCEVEGFAPGFEGCTHVFPASGLVAMDPKYERIVQIDEGMREATARAEAAEAENARLRAVIQHRGGPLCPARYSTAAECNCGVTAALGAGHGK